MAACRTKQALTEKLVVMLMAALIIAVAPAQAHHMPKPEGTQLGHSVPAIGHGEMLVVARYRSAILDLAQHQMRTDPTMRRLMGYVSLQHFACWWGLVPGSLTDEASPFNECSHADMAGTRALLTHLSTMPGAQSQARALEERIASEIAADPAFAALCSNSDETFDSGVIIGPEWRMAPSHIPTILTGLSLLVLAAACVSLLARCLRSENPSAASAA
ncbi:hypothetical protein [Bradyrhizobium sp. HKCCYLRH1030]|uniref:hypothetical protein n=1 Tax=Bradyrhizobium sp. HKCCYLRH1030 TaxID=3420744 RepID=UPI003EC1400D